MRVPRSPRATTHVAGGRTGSRKGKRSTTRPKKTHYFLNSVRYALSVRINMQQPLGLAALFGQCGAFGLGTHCWGWRVVYMNGSHHGDCFPFFHNFLCGLSSVVAFGSLFCLFLVVGFYLVFEPESCSFSLYFCCTSLKNSP